MSLKMVSQVFFLCIYTEKTKWFKYVFKNNIKEITTKYNTFVSSDDTTHKTLTRNRINSPNANLRLLNV